MIDQIIIKTDSLSSNPFLSHVLYLKKIFEFSSNPCLNHAIYSKEIFETCNKFIFWPLVIATVHVLENNKIIF